MKKLVRLTAQTFRGSDEIVDSFLFGGWFSVIKFMSGSAAKAANQHFLAEMESSAEYTANIQSQK